MKKYLALFVLFITAVSSYAQEEEEEQQQEGWTTEGKIGLLFNQSAFNDEWTGGGTSNIAANLLFSYDANYLLGDFTWDNKIIADYGYTRQNGDDFGRKTSDRLELNSIAGKRIRESNWFYSLFMNFRTQITKGYRFSEDPVSGETLRTEYTNFLSPAYLQIGPGLLWKKKETLYLNISPVTGRVILVDPAFTSAPDYEDGAYFGVDAGKSSRWELGAAFSGYAKFDIIRNVNMENLLSLYSNYMDQPGNVDIDYTMNMTMTINDYLSTNLIFQAIYDDNAVSGFQIREVFGLGFNYGF